jgi:hypothetical protein
MVPEPITPCRCVERTVTTREELLLKDGKFVLVKMQFECCECGKYAAVKILDSEDKS